MEKTSFACLSKLFEIDAKERHYKTLLTARNLMAVVQFFRKVIPGKLLRKEIELSGPGDSKGFPIFLALVQLFDRMPRVRFKGLLSWFRSFLSGGLENFHIKGVSSIERGLGYQSLNKQREFSKTIQFVASSDFKETS